MSRVFPLIQLVRLSKSFPQGESRSPQQVLDQVTLEVYPGETLAITGPSGSGKTTLLNIMGLLDNPDSGEYFLDKEDILQKTSNEKAILRNQRIGFVFQQHLLLPQLNALENVLLAGLPQQSNSSKKEKLEWALQLLDQVGLRHYADKKPGQLSVGECQRVALARALFNKPTLLLADEPTGSLDQKNAGLMGDLLLQMNSELQTTIVVVTHTETLAERMQTRYQLQGGKLIKLS